MTDLAADVLIIDDQKLLVKDAVSRFQPHFGTVQGESDPSAVVKRLRSGDRFGVMLCDVLMEPLSGLDLVKLARDADPHVQVLIMTAAGTTETAIKALQLGAVDFVLKPIDDWDGLIRSAARALETRNLSVENERLLSELKVRNEELDRSVQFLRRLNVASQEMHAAKDVKKILNIVADTAREWLQAQRVSVMIRDPRNDEMAISMQAGMDPLLASTVKIQPWEGVAGKVLAQRAPVIVNDPTELKSLPQDSDKEGRYRGVVFMSVPLTLGSGDEKDDKVMGVLNVTEHVDDRPFSPIEIEFASHLARQAAHALTGAALWKSHTK